MCLSDPIGNEIVRREDILSICLGRSIQFQEAIFQYSSSVSSTSERGAVAIGILSLTSTMAGVTTNQIVLLVMVKKEMPCFRGYQENVLTFGILSQYALLNS